MAPETCSAEPKSLKLLPRIHIGYGEAAVQYCIRILATKHVDAAFCARTIGFPDCALAIGTIFHYDPAADGAALGAAIFMIFRLFCALVQGMDGAGVFLTGIAVILP